jgi:ATP-dependent RNA helicase MSS116
MGLDVDDTNAAATTIEQTYAVLPVQRMISGVVELILHLQQHTDATRAKPSPVPSNKLLVFFPTTSQVIYYSSLLNHHLGRRVWEMHSGMSQSQRMAASDAFRHARTGILLTSDVSARGLDYPWVSHVVQVGIARNRESYLHRLGRTGRAGRHGKGVLLVLEPELESMERDLAGLSIELDERLQRLLDRPASKRLSSDLLQVAHELRSGQADELMESTENCYRSLLSYYYSRLGSKMRRDDPARIDAAVDLANSFSYQSGLPELPTVPIKLATQYGLLNHPRLNIDQRWTVGTRFDVGTTVSHTNEGVASGEAIDVSAELWSDEDHLD